MSAHPQCAKRKALAGKTVPQLRAVAKERGLVGYSKLAKNDLCKALHKKSAAPKAKAKPAAKPKAKAKAKPKPKAAVRCDPTQLGQVTVAQLRAAAKRQGLTGYAKLRKRELCERVGGVDVAPKPAAPKPRAAASRARNLVLAAEAVKHTEFMGTLSDTFAGILYFMRKYPNDCAVIPRTAEGTLLSHEATRLVWDCKGECQLHVPPGYAAQFRRCLSNPETRFVFGSVRIVAPFGGHANMWLYDRKHNTVEIFEPHGKIWEKSLQVLDLYKAIERYFSTMGVARVLRPADFCPRVGVQTRQEVEAEMKRTDPGGFCAAWSLWWIHMRLEHAHLDLTPKQLYDRALEQLQNRPESLTSFIRNYSAMVTRERKRLAQEAKASIAKTAEGKDILQALDVLEKKLRDEPVTRARSKRAATLLEAVNMLYGHALYMAFVREAKKASG